MGGRLTAPKRASSDELLHEVCSVLDAHRSGASQGG